jgi:hypothetical protein
MTRPVKDSFVTAPGLAPALSAWLRPAVETRAQQADFKLAMKSARIAMTSSGQGRC